MSPDTPAFIAHRPGASTIKHLRIQPATRATDTALLLLRLSTGAAFVLHGWAKMQTPFTWMPAEAPVHIMPFFQGLAAFAEFGGGLALLSGLLTRLGALGLVITMTVAVYTHAVVFHDPFVRNDMGSSFESALGYLLIALLFMVQGPGRYALDKLTFGTNPEAPR